MSRPAVATRSADAETFLPTVVLLASVGLALRLIGAVYFWRSVGDPPAAWQCAAGAGIQTFALLLARRRAVARAIVVTGVDFVLIASLTPRFGTAADLHLYALLLPFLVLGLERLPLPTRLAMALVPPIGFVLVRFTVRPTLEGEVLSRDQLRDFSTVNSVIFVGLCMAVVVFAIRAREAATARAERLAEDRSRLVDDMSHELRTPVSILLTAAQASLVRERPGDAYRESLGLIERQSRGLGRMIARMLELSQAERADVTLEAHDDLAATVRDVVADFRELGESRSVTLELASQPVAAMTDAAVLRMVLGNLLANAVRFSPEGGRVEVELAVEGGRPRLSVRDQGPGIAREDLPHIFDRYWRADRARSRRDGHLGLGLSIAQHYAALLGATLEARSEPGHGTELIVRWNR